MKLSNFNLIKTEGRYPLDMVFFAEVDVETGLLFWKKKERMQIAKRFAGHWFFVETGKFILRQDINDLARSYAIKTGNEYL